MPRRNVPPLNSLSAFEAVARHMSFTRAAEELNVTQGAVSRQVRNLEEHLGVQLFERGPHGLELTKYGRQYIRPLSEAFQTIAIATSKITTEAIDNCLTVNMFPTLAMKWFVPRVQAFSAEHPKIELRLVTSMAPIDPSRDDFDVAIRVGDLRRRRYDGVHPRIDLTMARDFRGLKTKHLMPDVLTPVCSPKIMSGSRPVRSVEDLRRHTLIHVTSRATAWADWLRAVGGEGIDGSAGPCFGQFFLAIQAALEGRGLAIVPRILVEADLKAGTLVAPFTTSVPSAGAYYLLCRKPHWDVPKVRLFRTWIMAETAPYNRASGPSRQ